MTLSQQRIGKTLWRGILITAPMVLAVVAALVAAEGILRSRAQRVGASNHLDPGLSRYDAHLGWSLTPLWGGEHRNSDFAARYFISELGFRADSPNPAMYADRFTAVLGDSFTFGFGVNDDETFVARLNATAPPEAPFVNFGIPGYSTDQEALLLERVVLALRPARVLLVVYLGNDLLDNPLPYPIQVELGKPFFTEEDGQLVLNNTPVPRIPRPPGDTQAALRAAVLGDSQSSGSAWSALVSRSILLSTLGEKLPLTANERPVFSTRLGDEVALFMYLVRRLQSDCRERSIDLRIALLAGRSLVERPNSLSGQFQEYFRSAIAGWIENAGIPVIDLAQSMRNEYQRQATPWYFPNDGHLTPEGHRYVATLLAHGMNGLAAAPANP